MFRKLGQDIDAIGFDQGLKFRSMILPDIFIDHDKPVKQYELAGLQRQDITALALGVLGVEVEIDDNIRPVSA